jgi:hypothetical protein
MLVPADDDVFAEVSERGALVISKTSPAAPAVTTASSAVRCPAGSRTPVRQPAKRGVQLR